MLNDVQPITLDRGNPRLCARVVTVTPLEESKIREERISYTVS